MNRNPLALRDERARVLTELDDIIDTAKEAGRSVLDQSEQTRHDALAARFDQLDAEIHGGGAPRPNQAWRSVGVNLNRSSAASTGHQLDELMWATDESVTAGSVNDKGVFAANQFGARNSVEQVVVRSEANGPGTLAPRIAELPQDVHGAVRSFQSTVADMVLFGLMVDKYARSSKHGFEVARSHPMFADRWQHALRAMDVDTATEGGNWVPTGIGAAWHQKVRASGKIAPLFQRIDIPTNPWKWPVEGGDATAYRVGEPVGDTETKMTASTPGTVAPTFDAEIFGARTLVSRSMEADSAAAILPYIKGKLVRAFVNAEERAILDGDSDGTHQDSDVAASTTDARTAWDGLRKRALANASQALTTMTAANIATLRKGMGKWGLNPEDLALIVGINNYYTLLSDSNLLTVDKFGPQATILNGQIGSVHGIPVIASEYVREDLAATGLYTGTGATTYFLLVNRGEWAMGQRMAMDVEVDDSIYRETYQRVLVGFMREDFQNIGDASTNDDTAVAVNVTP
jgi:hypothetical protein